MSDCIVEVVCIHVDKSHYDVLHEVVSASCACSVSSSFLSSIGENSRTVAGKVTAFPTSSYF